MANGRSRTSLYLEAVCWRVLSQISMFFHRLGSPRPLSPRFTRTIDTTVAPQSGRIKLVFYTPDDYGTPGCTKRYPCLINFHGGGFTLGGATDDSRWATAVTQRVGAVVCSVNYRCAPEHPFPTAVEDGADAVMWVLEHAEELGVDEALIGTSGFSAGGNLAITALLKFQEVLSKKAWAGSGGMVLASEAVKIMVPWYPVTDFTITPEEKRRRNPRPNNAIPKFLMSLFGAAYVYPPEAIDRRTPFLSPSLAPDELLRSLPQNVVIITCEWDDFRIEAEIFGDRLRGLGKEVKCRMVEGMPHGWDKRPNTVFRSDELAEAIYGEACEEIKRAFYGQ